MITGLPGANLNRFQVADIRSADEICELFARYYRAKDFSLCSESGPFRGTSKYLPLRRSDLSYNAIWFDLSAMFPGGDDLVRQQFILSGSTRLTVGRSQFHLGTNDIVVMPGEAEVRRDCYQNNSQLLLRVQSAALRSKLAALIGKPISRKIEFTMGVPAQTTAQMRLRRLVDFLVSEVDREDAEMSNFQFAELEQLLMVSFLLANPHNFSHLLKGEPPAAAPWQVRLVEEYIESNWDRAITIEELARETGVGMRNMFAAFKKARGYTPMAFLQHIRLRHARQMLETPDATTSVAVVGLKCGFYNAGHFAGYYRQAFGELPSVTLAMAKGRTRMGR